MISGSLIFLTILFVVSISLSASVVFFLLSIGTHSGAAKLTLLLNLSFIMIALSKFPVYLVRIPYSCDVAGYIYWYFSTLGLLVLYDLVGAVNLRMLVHDQTSRTISRASEYNIQDSSTLRLFIIPLVSLIAPLCSGSFISSEKYCEIDRDSAKGIYSRIAYLVFTLLIQIAILRKLYLTCELLRRSLSHHTYHDLFWKLLTGPGAYPIILVLATLVADVVILITHLSHAHLSGSESDYCLEILQAVLGIFTGIIFFSFERRDIQVPPSTLPPHSTSHFTFSLLSSPLSSSTGLRVARQRDARLREDDGGKLRCGERAAPLLWLYVISPIRCSTRDRDRRAEEESRVAAVVNLIPSDRRTRALTVRSSVTVEERWQQQTEAEATEIDNHFSSTHPCPSENITDPSFHSLTPPLVSPLARSLVP
jgi:hypothetical protein